MMNNELVLGWAEGFAGRVLKECGQTADRDAWVATRSAWRTAPARRRRAADGLAFWEADRSLLANATAPARNSPRPTPPVRSTRWTARSWWTCATRC